MHSDNWQLFAGIFSFLGDVILIAVTYVLFLSISSVAYFHFFPTLKSQQEGQKLVAWVIQNQITLSFICTSGVRI